MKDEQDHYDSEDARLRLERLIDAIAREHEATEHVHDLAVRLKIARSKLKTATRQLRDLAFLSRKRRERKGS